MDLIIGVVVTAGALYLQYLLLVKRGGNSLTDLNILGTMAVTAIVGLVF